jgi:hypothetical protein
MKRVIQAWAWSLAVVARSPAALVGLAMLAALWGFAAFEWLSLPESSLLILAIAFAWALAMWLVAAGVAAGTASSAAEAAAAGGSSLAGFGFVTLRPRLLVRAMLFSWIAAATVFGVSELFGWLNGHTVEVGSFLTFHTDTPTSHIWLEKVFSTLEWLLWVAVAGLLVRLWVSVVRAGWTEIVRGFLRAFADCFWKGSFLSSLLAVLAFGWVPDRLANWQPHVPPGFWDYFQMLTRLGLALLLLAFGWLFWLLALARLSLAAPSPAAKPVVEPSAPHS